jgi:hypothetical protein
MAFARDTRIPSSFMRDGFGSLRLERERMTNEERLLALEAEMSIAKADISAMKAATLGLAFVLMPSGHS